MSNDFGLEQLVETDCPLTGASCHLAEESPLVAADRRKVTVFDPTPPFVRMASPSPTAQHFHQNMIHIAKGIRADNMPVIHRPTPQKWVEQKHQMSGCRLWMPLHDPAYLFQQGRDVAFGGFNQKLAPVLANVLPQEVEVLLRSWARRTASRLNASVKTRRYCIESSFSERVIRRD